MEQQLRSTLTRAAAAAFTVTQIRENDRELEMPQLLLNNVQWQRVLSDVEKLSSLFS